METIWIMGAAFISWFQGLGTWLVAPMNFFSFLGSENFFLIALPLVYWCVDASAGLRLGVIVLFSSGFNDILKMIMHGPRPSWFTSQVKVFAFEPTFGVPSGHSQTAVALWGTAAAQIKRPWAWLVAILIMLMVGLSRLYLGVHFPHDVLLGWIIGTFLLWVFNHWWGIIANWAKRKSLGQQIGLALVVSVAFVILGMIGFGTLRGWQMPEAWMANIKMSGWQAPSPVSLDNTITSAGLLFGMWAGLAWMNSKGGFETHGSVWQRAIRLIPGLLGVLVFYLGLKAIFPQGNDFISYFFRYIRYSFVGLWVSAGAPWIFLKLNLVRRKEKSQAR